MLDQFERNPEQQSFVLSVIEKLEARSRASPELFNDIPLTVLSEMSQVGRAGGHASAWVAGWHRSLCGSGSASP